MEDQAPVPGASDWDRRQGEAWHQRFPPTEAAQLPQALVCPAWALPGPFPRPSAGPQSHLPEKEMFIGTGIAHPGWCLNDDDLVSETCKGEREWGLNYSHQLFFFSKG